MGAALLRVLWSVAVLEQGRDYISVFICVYERCAMCTGERGEAVCARRMAVEHKDRPCVTAKRQDRSLCIPACQEVCRSDSAPAGAWHLMQLGEVFATGLMKGWRSKSWASLPVAAGLPALWALTCIHQCLT